MSTKYIITRQAFNVLGDQLPDQTLSVNDKGDTCWASCFERFKFPVEFIKMDDAFSYLMNFLNVNEKYFYDDIGNVYRLISDTEIYKQGFKIEDIK